MINLLAQAVENPQIYEVVKNGVEAGIKETATSRPSEWLMVLLSLVISYFFLRSQRVQTESFTSTIKDLNESIADRKNAVESAVDKMNSTIVGIQAKFAEDARVSQRECHQNTISLKEGQGVLHEIAHDIKDAVVGVKEQTASQERIAASQRESLHSLRNTVQQIKAITEIAEARRQHEHSDREIVILDPPATKEKL